MIAVIDYGLGNLKSVTKALDSLGYETVITSDKEVIRKSELILLPGVGAFPAAMRNLRERGLDAILKKEVKAGKYLLGICLGMQLLFEYGEEGEKTEGLGFIPGTVKKLEVEDKIPHMGWNELYTNVESPLLQGVDKGNHVYFVHSFYASTESCYVNAYADYHIEVPAVVSKGNVAGFQFHPEKSGDVGLKILSNIERWIKC